MGKQRGHVAVVTSNFWPEPTGTSQTVTEFAEYLARHGIPVEVATSMPYYPEWRIRPAYRRALWRTERRDGIRIRRSWHFVRPRPTTITRILHEATLSLLALPNMVRVLRGARRAYIVSPALSYALTAAAVARLLRVRFTLVVKDVMPDAAVELGMMTNPIMVGASRRMARAAYGLADEIHTLGEGMRRRIAREADDPEKIHIVPDTIDPGELEPVSREVNEFRQRFVPDGTFAVLHTGNMGKKQDLFLLLRAAERLRHDRSVHFYVFGDGAVRDDFLSARDARGLDNVSHYPLQERRMLRHMLSGADAVLVSQLPEVVDIVVPSKLLTALAAGAMIVAACAPDSETARLVDRSGGGVRTPAGDDEALARAIADIRAGSVDAAACREAARAFATETFGRDAVYGPIAAGLGAEIPRADEPSRRPVAVG
jgi:colanic acid biosynthesis glycosyl transferase WcaI